MRSAAAFSSNTAPVNVLMDAVYDAAFAPDEWQTVCDWFHAAFGAFACIASHDLVTNRNLGAYYSGHDDAAWASYKQHHDQHNILIEALRVKPEGASLRMDELVPPNVLERSKFYTEWLKPQGELNAGGLAVLSNKEHRIITFSALLPRAKAEPSTDDLMAVVELIVPHMQRSLRLNQSAHRVANKASILETFMEEARAAFLVLDEQGRPLEVNRQARALFDGGVLTLDFGGSLMMNHQAGSNFIQEAVAKAAAGSSDFGDGIAVPIDDLTPSGYLRAIPLGTQGRQTMHQLMGTRSHAAVIISISSSQPMLKAAQARFGLSPAEAAVLSGLVQGKGLKELAADRNTSIHTVRNQVASLLEKTGTSSQKELVGIFAAPKRI
ncbi:helix-turn-helix transcriptional regulator [Pelagibacterium luteolum]|uniref:Regulatory protein, luxR family n=1 Tax=Pelagibacterium luteolum TaxID=440168 RepID=A0A1G7SW25_9HYPH|nr:helix-turn-helix transcriptional regulator [Pelagibacterium luteolum]SDG27072.1 regulatory protein, luxR family [Pelagibacterium luteolum]